MVLDRELLAFSPGRAFTDIRGNADPSGEILLGYTGVGINRLTTSFPWGDQDPTTQTNDVDRVVTVTLNEGLMANPSTPGDYAITIRMVSVDPDTDDANDEAGSDPIVLAFERTLSVFGAGEVPTPPGLWSEDRDALAIPGALIEPTRGEGALERIVGTTDSQDLQDGFCIRIDDPSAFRATTEVNVDAEASADFDTRLYLFRSDGAPLLVNDDSGGGTGSTLEAASTDGSGFTLTRPGDYQLFVVGSADEPRDGSGQSLFDFPIRSRSQRILRHRRGIPRW